MEIMISYVRREAEQHARDLKNELDLLQCRTFLDVDEIKAGNNWQDVLNNAVIKCEVFVALITPSYGETKWTKRELQFADTLDKLIIPINFLKSWPPLSLAINLFSTNFIPWKTEDDIKEEIRSCDINRAYDILLWDKVYVKRAAKIISERYLLIIASSINMGNPLYKNAVTMSSYDDSNVYEFDRTFYLSDQHINYEQMTFSVTTNEKISVVISCCIKQEIFSVYIRDYLVKLGYQVCISSEDQFNEIKFSQKIGSPSHSNKSRVKTFFLKLFKKPPKDTVIVVKNKNYGNNWDNITDYRNKLEKAWIVILILSEDYYKSITCKQQAFYCNNNVRVIAIQYDNYKIPLYFEKLFDEQNLLIKQCSSQNDLITTLRKKIETLVSRDSFFSCDERLNAITKDFCLKFPFSDDKYAFVYIANRNSVENRETQSNRIYECIGKEFAKIPNLILLSGNDFADNLVVNGFIEESKNNSKFYHILPNGMTAENGQTVNVGNSIKERDSVVSQLSKFYLLIDTGNEAIRIAEEFLWNDNYVIPVVFGDSIDENNDEIPDTIKKMPIGVEMEHWNALFDKHETPENISIAVKNVIICLTKVY